MSQLSQIARRKLRSRRGSWLAAAAAAGLLAGGVPAIAAQAGSPALTSAAADTPGYAATIVRTAYGIPHITAASFGSLGFGYGSALASDDLCTVANGYITVEGERSRYFGPSGSVPDTVTPVSNQDSDVFWQSVIGRRIIPGLLAVRSGPGAIGSPVRQLIGGYVAGYNQYLASVGGQAGVPDPICRGKPWVKPITTLDAYLLVYQAIEFSMQQEVNPGAIATARPPAGTAGAVTPAAAPAATSQRLSVARPPEGIASDGIGSNGIAVGSAGTRDHQAGMLLGNPHFLWDGPERFYQVQLTIPGTLNVEGATFYGMPLVMFGFTATMAWTLTSTPNPAIVPYQLTLVPGHPTEYLVDGKPEAMTSQPVTVQELSPAGTLTSFHDTVYYTRYGPVVDELRPGGLPWTATTAFTVADVNSGNFRFLNSLLATDETPSVPAELTVLDKYEGLPWMNLLAADSAGHAAYADVGAIPHISDAELASCDTALGATAFRQDGLPILDGSRSACALGTDADSAAPGIFGPAEEPVLSRRDFVENSNDSYWMTNPADPLTGFPAVIAGADQPGTDLGLRTRSALTMITSRIVGSDGLGRAGFTLQDMKNLMFSDIQYGATLVKSQLVTMCRSFPGGLAPTSTGGTIEVGDSCDVLAAWDGQENPDSRGAALFQAFWCPFVFTSNSPGALCQSGSPWTRPFSAADPVGTPSGLDTASTAVQQAFGDALASLTAAHLPYDVPLGQVQYVVRNGQRIPLPGGPGDPSGDFNAIDQLQAGADPIDGSSYIQAVTWNPGDSCPQAATLLTYSESGNPTSPHYADQTMLFSRRQWVTPYFCAAQVAAHAVSTTLVRSLASSQP